MIFSVLELKDYAGLQDLYPCLAPSIQKSVNLLGYSHFTDA